MEAAAAAAAAQTFRAFPSAAASAGRRDHDFSIDRVTQRTEGAAPLRHDTAIRATTTSLAARA